MEPASRTLYCKSKTQLKALWRTLLMTIWLFASFLIVDRKEGVFSSLSLSQKLVTHSNFGNYFLLVVILVAISLAPSAVPYVGVVVAWFLMPIAWLLEASAYLQVVDESPSTLDDVLV